MAQATVRLPPVLRELVACDRQVAVAGETVGDALRHLVDRYPALGLHLFDDRGELRRLILCFCNHEDVRDGAGLDRRIQPGDTISIVNSVAGG